MDENIHKTAVKIIATILSIVLLISIMIIIPKGSGKTVSAAVQPDYINMAFDEDKVNEINIEIAQTDWEWLMKNAVKEEYKSCNITINGKKYNNVGIRPKGNSSLMQLANSGTEQRYSFKLDFGKYVDGQTYNGLAKMVLNNIMSDKSYMKEYLSYGLFDFIGVASPACAYSNIKVNNKDWGLYLAVEVIDESFINRQFGSSSGNLYKPEGMDMGGGNKGNNEGQPNMKDIKDGGMPFQPGNGRHQWQNSGNQGDNESKTGGNMPFRGGFGGMGARGGANLKYTDDSASSYSVIRDGAIFKTTTDSDFEKVIEMIKNLNSGTNLEKYLDVDEILRFWAANTFLVNLDSYAGGMYHNYYLYEEYGVFRLLPWDFNLSFAGMNVNNSSSAINFPIDMPVTGSLEDAPLIGKLLEVPEYKAAYHNYMNEIVEKYINSGLYESSINKINKLISNYVKNDATAFYTFEEYQKALPAMVTFGKDRAGSVKAQLNGTQSSTSYGNMATSLELSDLGGMGGGGGFGGHWGNSNSGEDFEPGNMQPPGNMQMPENMQEIMQIISEANGAELTDAQKKKLKELGADDNMVNMFQNIPNGRMFQGKGGMNNESATRNTSDKGLDTMVIILILSIAAMFACIIFVMNFRRKRYVVCKQ